MAFQQQEHSHVTYRFAFGFPPADEPDSEIYISCFKQHNGTVGLVDHKRIILSVCRDTLKSIAHFHLPALRVLVSWGYVSQSSGFGLAFRMWLLNSAHLRMIIVYDMGLRCVCGWCVVCGVWCVCGCVAVWLCGCVCGVWCVCECVCVCVCFG